MRRGHTDACEPQAKHVLGRPLPLTQPKQLLCCGYSTAHSLFGARNGQADVWWQAQCCLQGLDLIPLVLPPVSLSCPTRPPGCRHGEARGASQVIEALRQVILHLYDAYLAPDGKAVNYKRLAADPIFKDYVNATAELQKVRRLQGTLQWQKVDTALSSGWAPRCNGRGRGIRVSLCP